MRLLDILGAAGFECRVYVRSGTSGTTSVQIRLCCDCPRRDSYTEYVPVATDAAVDAVALTLFATWIKSPCRPSATARLGTPCAMTQRAGAMLEQLMEGHELLEYLFALCTDRVAREEALAAQAVSVPARRRW